MAEKSVVNALPRLPGYDFSGLSQPTSFSKAQCFTFVKGIPFVRKDDDAAKEVPSNRTGFQDKAIMAAHLQWASLSDKVLRFFGYFSERVEESWVEKVRNRKVSLNYYLVDGTLSVTETPAVLNCGLRAGTLMSRHYERTVNAKSLSIGGSITLRSQTIHLVDCDAATREYYATMGIPQPEPLSYPQDTFESSMLKPKQAKDADHIQMKRIIESQAAAFGGKVSTMLSPAERTRAKMFLEHDKEVLTFFVVWEKRHFRMHYFVSDDTISVVSIHSLNDGRDSNGTFMKRARMPKTTGPLKMLDTISTSRTAEPQFYDDKALITGSTITLFAREFYIYATDEFTKNYYRTKYAVELTDYPKPATEGEEERLVPPTELPPYNGFGSEEDSAGSCRNMVMKPPKKDCGKFVRHGSDVLRFAAEFSRPAPEDARRQFILCFFLADDTVSVYEYAVRNSGHTGGKIFSRSKVPSVSPDCLIVGNEVKLGGFTFILKETDERSRKFLETGISMDVQSEKASELLARVRHVLTQRYSRVTEAYRHFSVTKSGLGLSDLQRMCSECEVKIEDPEILNQVMSLVDHDGDGIISLQEFVENVLKQTLVASSKPSGHAPVRSYTELQAENSKREFADRVLKNFVAKLEARRAFIVDTFRIVSDRSVDGLITADTFRQVVQDRLALNFTHEELDALVYRFFFVTGMVDWQKRRLSLREFRKIVEA